MDSLCFIELWMKVRAMGMAASITCLYAFVGS